MNTRTTRGRVLAVLLAAAVLMLGANVATYAGTGKSLLLGRTNKATKTTKLASTHGPALSLTTRGGAPPLAVTSRARVGRLNADMVDGYHATSLMTATTSYAVPPVSTPAKSAAWKLGPVPAGAYEVGLDLMFTATAPGGCLLRTRTQRIIAGSTETPVVSDLLAVSASAVVRLAATDSPLELSCYGEGTLQTWPDSRPQVTLTKIDILRGGTATAVVAPRTGGLSR